VAVIAEQHEKHPENVARLYMDTYSVLFVLALPRSPCLHGLYTPYFDALDWADTKPRLRSLGACSRRLVLKIHSMDLPSSHIWEKGSFGWGLTSQVTVAVLNLALGIALGRQFGGVGVFAGGSSALYGAAWCILAFT